MATIFPADPAVDDEYQGYRFDGTSWNIIGIDLTAEYPEITGGFISDTVIPVTIARVSDVDTSLGDYIPLSTKGEPLGVAELNASGQVPSAQLDINLSGYATESYVGTAISNLIDAAPASLDTLNELAAALGDDANYASTITTALGNKQDVVSGVSSTEIGYLDGVTSGIQSQLNAKAPLASPTFTGTASIDYETGVYNLLNFVDNTTSLGYIKKGNSTNSIEIGSGPGTSSNHSKLILLPTGNGSQIQLSSYYNDEYQVMTFDKTNGAIFSNSSDNLYKEQLKIKANGEVEIPVSAKIKNPALNIDTTIQVPEYLEVNASLYSATGTGDSFYVQGTLSLNPADPDQLSLSSQLVEIVAWDYTSSEYLAPYTFYFTGSGDWSFFGGTFTLVDPTPTKISNVEIWLTSSPYAINFKYATGNTTPEDAIVTISKEELLTLNGVTSNIQDQINATVPYTKGGTGLTTLGTQAQVLMVNDNEDGIVWGPNVGNIGDSGWINVSSLSNNFTAPTSVAYRKINGVVYMRGNLFNGTANTVAFTLPPSYRPSVEVVVPAQKYGTGDIAYVTVNTSGQVIPISTAAWLSSVIFPMG